LRKNIFRLFLANFIPELALTMRKSAARASATVSTCAREEPAEHTLFIIPWHDERVESLRKLGISYGFRMKRNKFELVQTNNCFSYLQNHAKEETQEREEKSTM
jgi:hypothetical protein